MSLSKSAVLISGTALFLLFQNFSSLDEQEKAALFPKVSLSKARGPASVPASPYGDDARAVLHEMNSIKAPETSIVAPQGGSDLNSVAGDWAQRQSHVWLDGADQRLLASINGQLNDWFSGNDNSVQEPSPIVPSPVADETPRKKSDWHFTRVNSLQYDVDHGEKLTMHIEGDGGHIDYSKEIDKKTKLAIEHQAAKNQTQLLIRYNW